MIKRTSIAVVAGALLVLALVLPGVSAPPDTNTDPNTAPIISSITTDPSGATGTVHANDESSGPYSHSPGSPPLTTASSPPTNTVIRGRQRISQNTATEHIVTINNKEYPLRAYRPLLASSDPLANQWWVNNTKLEQTWDVSTGSTDMTIAIIDTGFALSHEEFANRWYQSPGETGTAAIEGSSRLNCTDRSISLNMSCNLVDDNLDGIVDNESGATSYQNPSQLNCTARSLPLTKSCNVIDDDSNGFVDDVTGWDFMNYDNSVQAGQLNPGGSGTTHGTMVAGVAAATGDNNKGIAGVNWRAKILPVQALDDDGYGDTVSVGQSIYYAVAQDVDVISISLGTPLEDYYVREAIEAATAAGIVVVAASGNDGCECLSYPARHPEVVAVGALASTNTYASFSSWGAELDILAPGTNISTATWSSTNGTSRYASGVAGTSFATPYVAGLIATMKGQRPTANPLQLIGALTENTTKNPGMTNVIHDTRFGSGTVDASAALNRVATPVHANQAYVFTPIRAGEYFSTSQPKEVAGTYSVIQCVTGNPSTAIYELTKPGQRFFTISKTEARTAQISGYTSALFSYGCIQQNHDTFDILRGIDIFKEFRNDYSRRTP